MRTHARPAEPEGELNVLPYLDVLMNLIIFMLLSMTGLAAYRAIDVTRSGSGPAAAVSAEVVQVFVDENGFSVRRGETLTSVPKRANGEPDYAGLTAALAALKSNAADRTAELYASADTSYERVVATLDAMRGSAGAPLFPEVSLAAAR